VIESLLIILTMVLMLFSLGLIVIPVMPVSALEWALAMLFAGLSLAFTGSSRVTLPAAMLMTVFMLMGSTSALWMPFLGLRGKDLSCLGLIAFFVGCIIGGIVIPVPLLGSMLGGVLAVVIVEYAKIREFRQAVRSGGTALKVIIYGMVAEFIFATAIVATFIISILTTNATPA
jgi:uncharacterized protein YqgC (DUF456 family)